MSDLRTRTGRIAGRAALLLTLAASGGCSGFDGVEFNGKLFEAVGLTGSLGKKVEPKTEPRAPLVLPPPSQGLAEPGTLAAPAAPVADPQWPQDPDRNRVAQATALEKAQKDYCRDGNWKEKAMGNDMEARKGPAGDCTGSIFSVIGKSLFGD